MINADVENSVFITAADFICNSNYPVFLTGKAGTGKTTFLKHIRENSGKHAVIVAPTGVAAINAGGTTIHSFFQLPFTPYIPVKQEWGNNTSLDKHALLSKVRLSADRRELMQQMELLVIDEISMVRCDVLDAVDTILRYTRNRPDKVFGGVQILYIGDLYQLPPVVKENEWQLLNGYYDNPFFFSSRVIKENPPIYIELTKVYRQADQLFIDLLNKVRNNEMTDQDLHFLNSRYDPGFKPGETEKYITLTTHNHKADEINREELAKLNGDLVSFNAAIEGDFNDNAFPAEEFLNIKTGAQVMFLKNDTEKVRRYFNGKIGIVEKIEEDKILIRCNTDDTVSLIEIRRETWRNIQFSLDKKTQQVEEKLLGSFTQFPIRLAWAITIHKSQGLTFEKAIIDAGRAFAPGQVYVALSRCTSLDGIVLRSRIVNSTLSSDERIVSFCSRASYGPSPATVLLRAKCSYQQEEIQDLFDFSAGILTGNRLSQLVKTKPVFGEQVSVWFGNIERQMDVFYRHGKTFNEQLNSLYIDHELPEHNCNIRERLSKAAGWYVAELEKLKPVLLHSPAVTDNRQAATEYNNQLHELWNITSRKLHLMKGILQHGLSQQILRNLKTGFVTEPLPVNAYSGKSSYVPKDIQHPELFLLLKEKRDMLAGTKGVPLYMVCGTISIEQMAEYLPLSLAQLERISGFGKTKLKQYGSAFLETIAAYCVKMGIEPGEDFMPDIPQAKKRKEKTEKKKSEKPDTKKLSFDMYREGKSIQEISATRNLAASTIEGHLSHFVETGDILVSDLVEHIKIAAINEVIAGAEKISLQKIKEHLPDISYGEIRWVVAAYKSEQMKSIVEQ